MIPCLLVLLIVNKWSRKQDEEEEEDIIIILDTILLQLTKHGASKIIRTQTATLLHMQFNISENIKSFILLETNSMED